MARRLAHLALLALLLLPALALSQVTKTKDGYLLRMKWKAGDFYSYNMLNSTEMSPGNPMEMDMAYSMKVLSIKDGIASVEYTMTNPMTKEPTEMTIKMNDRGIADEAMAAAMTTGNAQFGFQYPDKPLKAGDSWQSEKPMEMDGVDMEIDSTYTFVGLEIVNKVPCAKIIVKTSAVMNGQMKMSMETEGVIYIENKTGQLFSSTLDTVTEIDMGGKAMKLPSKTVIKRK